ncbi:MAG: PAS domain S-box protein [Mariprofundaceae bacterium]|nr:PAS domain S-box protein [Mariprofundaceae bacterium]
MQQPIENRPSAGQSQTGQSLSRFLLFSMGVLAFFSCFNYSQNLKILALVQFLVLLTLPPVYYWLRRGASLGIIKHLIGFDALVIFVPLMFVPTADNTGIYWIFGYPMIVFFFLGTRTGFAWTIIYLLIIVAGALLSHLGLLTLYYTPLQTALALIEAVVFTAIGYLFASDRERAERQQQSHLQYLENIDRFETELHAEIDIEKNINNALALMLQIFDCQRAWILYPCDPSAPCWHIPYEQTQPGYPGVLADGESIPSTESNIQIIKAALASDGPVCFSNVNVTSPGEAKLDKYTIKSQVLKVIRPASGQPWLLGLHNCEREAAYTDKQLRLFQDIGNRFEAALNQMLLYRKLHKSEQHLRQAQTIAHIGSWRSDMAGRITWSDETYRIYGVSPETFTPTTETFISLIHPDDQAAMQAWIDACASGEKPGPLEFRCVRPDGAICYIESQGGLVADAGGGADYMTGTAQDITERKQAEEALKLTQFSLEHAPDAVYWMEPSGQFLYVNEMACRTLGYTHEELLSMGVEDIDPSMPDGVPPKMAQATKEVGISRIETQHRAKDGRIIPVEVMVAFIEYGSKEYHCAFARDITERKLVEEALAEKQAQHDEAQRIAHLGSWKWGITDHSVLWSDEMYRIFGVSQANFNPSYDNFLSLVHPDDRERVAGIVASCLSRCDFYDVEHRIVRPDGAERCVHAQANVNCNDQGESLYMVGTVQDITESKRAKEELEQSEQNLRLAIKQAEAASHAKSEFLSVMSHELRTPLHGIIGLQKLISADAGQLSSEHQENLLLAQQSAKSLRALVSDVLDLAKIESGNMELVKKPFELKSCICDALVPFVLTAREKGITLSLHLENTPETIISDESRLRQVLLNLVGNAVKFTEHGEVSVHVFEQEGLLLFSVRDTGIGISRQDLEHIFEPFVQATNSSQPEHTGTGLGTTIVKRFVDLMEGNIEASSNPGKGSCFHFTIPCHPVGSKRIGHHSDSMEKLFASPPAVKEEKSESMPALRVLLAEDDPIGQRIATRKLSMAGMKVDAVSNGERAWEKMQSQPYDLLLTDVRMPGMNGITLTKKIRAMEKRFGKPPLPIIGLSAYAVEDVARQCLEAGMNHFMTKPVDPETILSTIINKASR